MPLNPKSAIEARPIVFPGNDGRHLDDLPGVEMVGELVDQRLFNRGWGGR